MLGIFKERNVDLRTGQRVLGITEEGVKVLSLDDGREEMVKADCVVVAVGTRRVDTLARDLEGKVPELISVGDCNQPRVIMEAIYEGSLVGRQI